MNSNPYNLFPVFWKSALFFLLVYLYLSLRMAPFGDEVWDWSMTDKSVYIAAERPGLAAYLSLFSGHGVPYAYCLAAAVFFAASMCTQTHILGISCSTTHLVFIAVQASVIQFSYLMIDSFLADAVMLGVFLASASCLLVVENHGKWLRMLAAALLAAMAASVYQLLLLIIPVLYLAYTLRTAGGQDVRRHLMLGFKTAGVCIAGVILYHCVKTVCLCGISEDTIESVSRYQSSLITWGQLDIVTHILHLGKQWCMHLIGAGYPGEYLYATTIVPAFMLTVSILKDTNIHGAGKLFYSILPAAVYVLPFLPMAALGEDQGARLYLAEPLACAALWILLIERKGWMSRPAAVITACALSGLVLLKACYTVSNIAFYQNRIFIENKTAYAELKNRVAQVENQAGFATGTLPMVLSGQWLSELRKKDEFNSCIIGPDAYFFHSFMGDRQARRVRDSAIPEEELQSVLQSMPAWPEPGSVLFHKGEIIVKFDSKRQQKED